jgi:hypothetical protein
MLLCDVSGRFGGTYRLHFGRRKNMLISEFHGGHCDKSSLLGMLLGVDLMAVEVSEKRIASIFMVERKTLLDLRFPPRFL